MSTQIEDKGKDVIILDTSAFIAGFDPFSLPQEQVTVPKVEEEIRRNSMVKMRFEMAIYSGKVKVKEPSQEAVSKMEAYAKSVGDAHNLSEADRQLLALTIDLKTVGVNPQIITDDYSIQNVATQIGVDFLSLATFGIKRLFEWIRYCPACHKQYTTDCKFKDCQVCGTELKRKPRRPKK